MIFKRNNRCQDVHHILALGWIFCSAMLSGCSDKAEETILPPKQDEETELVEKHNVYIGHPFNVYLPKETDGYKVDNHHPEKLRHEHPDSPCIARFTALCEGESSAHILDKKNKLLKIVEVQATMWGSEEVEVDNSGHPYLQSEVQVEAQDTQTKQNIEKELTQELKNRNGTRYTFDNQSRLFTITSLDGTKGYEGTYQCSADSLIMQTESIKKRYGYEVSLDKFLVVQEDRTQEFCRRYPEAGVTSVVTREIWRDQTILDIPYAQN